jgi:DNA polymerase-1
LEQLYHLLFKLDKLDGTYFVALAEQAGLDNTIHCNFLQHGTRTGRLSSSDPNLQNIPSRHDEWNVRKAFIPRKGYKFIMADYSQLELRIMAHFSNDETMVHTFKIGGDIHAETMKAIGSNRHHAKVAVYRHSSKNPIKHTVW